MHAHTLKEADSELELPPELEEVVSCHVGAGEINMGLPGEPQMLSFFPASFYSTYFQFQNKLKQTINAQYPTRYSVRGNFPALRHKDRIEEIF